MQLTTRNSFTLTHNTHFDAEPAATLAAKISRKLSSACRDHPIARRNDHPIMGTCRCQHHDKKQADCNITGLSMPTNRDCMESLVKPIRRDFQRAPQDPVAGFYHLVFRQVGATLN